ncbi:hypothetical protein ACHAPT_009615 [Fusarium lateritium]
MEDNSTHTGQYRSACAECHRRKQKKRKVADKCRFFQPNPGSSPSDSLNSGSDKKRARSRDDDGAPEPDEPVEGDDDGLGIEAMGYAAGPLFESLTITSQLKHALDVLPSRPQMDALVQSFFNNVNYHYYIIYPPIFLQEYQTWWDRRTSNKDVSLQWTILLVMVCACATQHLDVEMKPIVEVELAEAADTLTKEYHKAGTDLGRVIPVGHCHLLNIQWMLHSIYWYKAEARFVEAWHVIGAAVREAHELGLHRVAIAEGLTEFEREMRRRAWCVLDCWDWQFASGLGRPTIIDHTDIDVEPPSLTLEDLSPSPLLHMKLQSELVTQLAQRWSAPKNINTSSEVQEYKLMLEEWIRAFPAVYDVDRPDTSKDHKHTWIAFHRFYIHTMAYLMILNPMRSFMAQTYTRSTTEDMLAVRADAVYYSLKNLDTTTRWVDHVSHRDGRFHFIIFSLFDTAAVLSTAIIKDEDHTIPRRDEIVDAVDNSVRLLKRLKAISTTAKTSHDILVKMAQRMPRRSAPLRDNYRKKQRVAPAADPTPPMQPVSESGSHLSPGSHHSHSQGFESQHSSPSNWGGSDSVVAGSTPQSNYSYHDHQDNAGHVQTAPAPAEGYMQAPAPFDGSVVPNQVPSPSAGIDGVLEGGAIYAMPQPDPNMAGMLPPTSGSMVAQPSYAEFHPPMVEMNYGLENITDAELGDFSQLWDWRSLNLDFIHSST